MTALQGRVALVTGGGAGIGRAIAAGLAGDGVAVYVLGRTRATLAAALAEAGQQTPPLVADVADAAAVKAAVEQVLAERQRLDIVVHAAGVNAAGKLLELAPDAWEAAIRSHLLGWANLCRAALPSMLERGFGRLVSIGSRIAASPVSDRTAYSAAKAGQHALTRALALELAEAPDVRINDLVPGPTRTASHPTGQDPRELYPYVRALCAPELRASGQAWFEGEPFELFAYRKPLAQRAREQVGGLLRRTGLR